MEQEVVREEREQIDPLRDPQREQLCNDPFWLELCNEIPYFSNLYHDPDILLDGLEQYHLEDII